LKEGAVNKYLFSYSSYSTRVITQTSPIRIIEMKTYFHQKHPTKPIRKTLTRSNLAAMSP
ncbi:hypothetical protein, partial [Lacinutrix sp. MEBiC02404]